MCVIGKVKSKPGYIVNKEGNILAGTDGGGLNLYAPHLDSFISIHTQYNIPGDMICSILEDKQQNLWMGSNVGLIKLNLKVSIPLQTVYKTINLHGERHAKQKTEKCSLEVPRDIIPFIRKS